MEGFVILEVGSVGLGLIWGMQERRFKMTSQALACTTANVRGHQMRETEQMLSLCRGMNGEFYFGYA